MLTVEFSSCGLTEPGHLQLADFKSVDIYSINDLSNMLIAIRFNHSKSLLPINFKLLACGYITIISDLKLPSIYSEHCPSEELVHLYPCVGATFQKDPFVLGIVLYTMRSDNRYHFYGLITWEIGDTVKSHDGGLLIVPIGLEDVAFLAYYSCHFI